MTSLGPAHRFDSDTQLTPLAPHEWAAEVRPGWSAIGGQPNGGYLITLALAATTKAVPGTQPCTATAHFVRPAETGPAKVDVDIVRLGRLVSTVAVRLGQGSKDRLAILAALSSARPGDSPATLSPTRPELPGPEDCVEPPAGAAGSEADIAERFDYRLSPTTRWVRGSTGDTAIIEGWVRFSDGREPDLASLPVFADSFPAAIMEVLKSALAPTIELTIHLRQEPAPGWLQARFQTRLVAGGMLEEDGELWDCEGRLVAMSRQLALLLPQPG